MFQILTAPPSSHTRTQGVVESAEFPPSPLVLLVLYRQSGLLLSLSKDPACSMYYPRTCGMSGCTTERFKCELDRYLATVPDEPLVPGLTQYRRCDSNSVIDWANSPYLHQQDNQLQQHNYLELDEAVTTWRPVGSHKHYRVMPCEWSHSWDTAFSKFHLENPRSSS